MKKVVRLTEADLIRIVKRVISENETPKFDYIFDRNDGYTDSTPAKKLYFVSNGDSFDVFAENYTKDGSKNTIVNTNRKLPKLNELGVTYNMASGKFKNNDKADEGNSVARLITPPMERSNGNWVFFVNNEGIPVMGRLTVMNGLPIKGGLEDKGGKGLPLKDNETITGQDYFIVEEPSGKNKYGKGSMISIEDVEKSRPA
jgi:hypothetical protein